jgi:ketosteroid isomerase-like protein
VSEQNVALVRAILSPEVGESKEAILAALEEVVPAIFTEDVEFVEMPERVDARTFHGHEGVKEAYTRYLDQWDEYSAELIEVEDHGDQVFAVGLERASGRGSAAPVEDRVHMVFDFRGDEICRYREFHDREAALGALDPAPEDH